MAAMARRKRLRLESRFQAGGAVGERLFILALDATLVLRINGIAIAETFARLYAQQ